MALAASTLATVAATVFKSDEQREVERAAAALPRMVVCAAAVPDTIRDYADVTISRDGLLVEHRNGGHSLSDANCHIDVVANTLHARWW